MASATVPPMSDESSVIAELFLSEGHQSIRLPEQFHIDADRVRVRRLETGILLEPITLHRCFTEAEVEAWFTALDRDYELYGPFMPEGRNQPSMPEPGPDELFD